MPGGSAGRALIVHSKPSRNSLVAARALADAGWWVGIGSPRRAPLLTVSRATRRWEEVPSPAAGSERFVAAINEAIRARGYDIVFGADDAETLALSREGERIQAVVAHGEETVRATDKLHLATAARAAGLSTPETADASAGVPAGFAEPMIVKSRLHSIAGRQEAPTRMAVSAAKDRAEAERRIDEIRAEGHEPVVQPMLDGTLMALILLLDRRGETVARVQQRAERTYPGAVGVSARAQTVEVDESLAERATQMLRDLGATGLVELQFLEVARQEPRLIDLNARFYGSMALAIASGPNLPALWASLAAGEHIEPVGDGHAGVRFQWLEGDVRRAFEERRGSLVGDLASCLHACLVSEHGTWQPRDPLPTAVGLAQFARRGARSALSAGTNRARRGLLVGA